MLRSETPDGPTSALVSLLLATDLTRRVFPGQDRRALKRRAKEIADSEWAGAAVKRAIDDVNAAMDRGDGDDDGRGHQLTPR